MSLDNACDLDSVSEICEDRSPGVSGARCSSSCKGNDISNAFAACWCPATRICIVHMNLVSAVFTAGDTYKTDAVANAGSWKVFPAHRFGFVD